MNPFIKNRIIYFSIFTILGIALSIVLSLLGGFTTAYILDKLNIPFSNIVMATILYGWLIFGLFLSWKLTNLIYKLKDFSDESGSGERINKELIQ